jgi:pyruvate kinase
MVQMEIQPPRKTKIVATVGPSSWDPPILREMIEAGVDVMRLNFSHSDRICNKCSGIG